MEKYLGDEFTDFIDSLDREFSTSIRLNPLKNSGQFTGCEIAPWCENGRYLSERPKFIFDPVFHAGSYYVQEASSMFLDHVLKQIVEQKSEIKFLDLCAAPGGKTTLSSSFFNSYGLIVANEVVRNRTNSLIENVTKWGNDNVFVTNNDPADFAPLSSFFDLVLVDAPCSGEGLFRKEQLAVKKWSPDLVDFCAARQKRILKNALNLIKPGGHLIYCTCTYSTEENEQNTEWIAEQGGYNSIKINIDEKWGIVERSQPRAAGKIFSYHFYPHRLKGEGFFLTCFRKEGHSAGMSKLKYSHPKPVLESAPFLESRMSNWMKSPLEYDFYQLYEQVFAVDKKYTKILKYLNSVLNLKYFGVNLGKFKNDIFTPTHSFALSSAIHPDFPSLEVDLKQAQTFLRKESISFEIPISKGWYLIKFKNKNLGWVKQVNGKLKNYFPINLRIRKRM